jgi:hypothetical protein
MSSARKWLLRAGLAALAVLLTSDRRRLTKEELEFYRKKKPAE